MVDHSGVTLLLSVLVITETGDRCAFVVIVIAKT